MQVKRMISAVEAHAEGEPGRVITGGVGPIPGETVFQKMQWLQNNGDGLRKMMLREPRGAPALCANIVVEPCDPRADAGYIIMEQTEYPPMSGSNTICVVTVLLETGLLEMQEPVTELRLETPAGLIDVRANCADGKVTRVEFRNVPAFAVHLDVMIQVPGHGPIRADIAWGGMFFVIADAAEFGLELTAANGAEIIRACEALRAAAAAQWPVSHPENPEIKGPTISQLTGPAPGPGTHGQSFVSVSTGAFDPDRPNRLSGIFDRSPCGTGTCAKMAVLHAKGQLALEQDYVNAGPLGTTFTGRLIEECQVGPHPGVIPTLAGQGWIYGTANWMLDPSDPFPEGFTIGDIWAG